MNEKLNSLLKYQSDLKSKLESKDIPTKHTHRPTEYKQFLTRELAGVTAKITTMKEGTGAYGSTGSK